MHQFYIKDNQTTLSAEDSKHAIKVLRLVQKSKILIANGIGQRWIAEVVNLDLGGLRFRMLEEDTSFLTLPYQLHILLAPPAHPDRLEWCVEKCAELGVRSLQLIRTERMEYPKVKLERLEKIALAAFKQSQRVHLMEVKDLIPFEKIVRQQADKKLIAWLGEGTQELATKQISKGKVVLLIGPEGDFTPKEVDLAISLGYEGVRLGQARLRTETAAIAAAAFLCIKI
jgi:16S rRNA (uracil1498-N3)-methyltransferase